LAPRRRARGVASHPAAHILVGQEIEMRLNFVAQLGVTTAPREQRPHARYESPHLTEKHRLTRTGAPPADRRASHAMPARSWPPPRQPRVTWKQPGASPDRSPSTRTTGFR